MQNNHGVEYPATLDGEGGGENGKVRWFRGQQNISAAVKQGNYEFNLQAERARTFRIKITALTNSTTCVYSRATAGGDESSALVGVNQGDVFCLL